MNTMFRVTSEYVGSCTLAGLLKLNRGPEHVKEPGLTYDGCRPVSCTIPRNNQRVAKAGVAFAKIVNDRN